MTRFAALLLLALPTLAHAQTVAIGHDALGVADSPVTVSAKFKKNGAPRQNEAATVEVLGQTLTTRTDANGLAEVEVRPAAVGVFPVTIRVGASIARGRLHVIARDKPVVIVDIDNTISDLPFSAVPAHGDTAPTFAGAKELLTELSATHAIVYLTARPDFLDKKTRAFLAAREFPAGALLMEHRPGPGDDGQYKLGVLQALEARGVQPRLGIGNTKTDAFAYEGAGMRSYIKDAPSLKLPTGSASKRFARYAILRRQLIEDGVLTPAPGIVGTIPQ